MNTQLQGLYAITDETLMLPEKFALMAEAALAGGVSILQYRDKSDDHDKRLQQAYTLKELCLKYNATLIINDDIALATAVDADGIHIGKTDASLNVARQQLGAGKIIGVSCYNQLSLAEEAIHHGADYIAFGSFFSSSIKPDAAKAGPELITSIKASHDIPVCCIGGITTRNCMPLLNAEADMLAIISDIFSRSNARQISARCQQFLTAFNSRS